MPTITLTNTPDSRVTSVTVQGPRGPKGDVGPSVDDIGNISNVTITGVSDGDILTYDSITGKWINKTLSNATIVDTESSQTINGTKLFASDIDLNGNKLIHVGTPSASDDVVNVEYLENNAVLSDPTGITGAERASNLVILSQAEYDALGTYDSTTVYIIKG